MDPSYLSHALQLLVVLTPDWNAKDGTLCRYERTSCSSKWELVAQPISVNIGKNGMAWGRGLHDPSNLPGPIKKEGDGKTPAGIFSLGTVFGDTAHQGFAKKMPFLLIDEHLECVDDPGSIYYNQFVHRPSIQNCDWKSSEKMAEIGRLYNIGIVVQHNTDPIEPAMGSCIFMHLWNETKSGTAGCTAMEEKCLNEIVSWLDSSKKPCILQCPLEAFDLLIRM